MSAEPIRHLPPRRPPTLADLLERVARGDGTAMAQLYDATCARVHGMALRVLGDAHSAEEITVETYHQAWQAASSFDAARGSVETWLLTIARSRAIDRLRSRIANKDRHVPLTEEHAELASDQPGPALEAQVADRARLVQRALRSLQPQLAEVLELAFFEGLSHGAIARRLTLPLGTVKTRIRTGVRLLAETLSPIEERP